jgi:lysophospholipase L1-like esterase
MVLGRWSPGYFALIVAALGASTLLTAAHARPIYARLHRYRNGIVALGLSTLVALVLCEGVVRLADPAGISYYKWSKEYSCDRIPDDDLICKHRSNFSGTYDGIEYAFNEIGLRDAAIEPKAPNELRILVLGDSVTLGWGVAEEDTYCRQLESSLAARLKQPVRVINSGVGGYNTDQELAFFRRHAESLKPDLVLLLYVRNDVEVNVQPTRPAAENTSPPRIMRDLLGESWIYRIAHHFKTYGRSETGMIVLDREAQGWKASMRSVATLADDCARLGVPFVTFLWRYGPDPVTDALWEDLSALADERSFLSADTGPWHEGHDARSLRLSVVDSHPRPAGHAILARGMERFLVANDVLLEGVSWLAVDTHRRE